MRAYRTAGLLFATVLLVIPVDASAMSRWRRTDVSP
jgi:hypothetical protein